MNEIILKSIFFMTLGFFVLGCPWAGSAVVLMSASYRVRLAALTLEAFVSQAPDRGAWSDIDDEADLAVAQNRGAGDARETTV